VFCALVVVFFAAWSWVPFGFSPLGVPTSFVIALWGSVAVAGFVGIVKSVFSDEEWAPESWDGSVGESKAVGAAIVAGLYLLIVGCFAMIYLQVASEDSHAFSGTVDQVGAAYFAVDSFATTGFGDITPQNHLVRIIASVQELVGLALIAVVIAALAARLLEKTPEPQPAEPPPTEAHKIKGHN
jgi:hypothetical protein